MISSTYSINNGLLKNVKDGYIPLPGTAYIMFV